MNTQISSPEAIESEDQILAFAHTKRKAVVNHLTAKGMPSDPDDIRILLSALKDMDSQAIGRKRIKVDEKVNDLQAQSAALIAEVLKNTNSGRVIQCNDYTVINTPKLPDTIPAPVLVDGETDLELPNESYESFMTKFATIDD